MDHVKWQKRMSQVAKVVASWSKDEDRKVGAVITTHDYRILSTGYNGYPGGLDDTDTLLKNMKTIHAELNALLAIRHTAMGMKMFIHGGAPCSQCAAAIIQSKVDWIYGPKLDVESKWLESMILAQDMLRTANIEYRILEV